MRYDICLHSSSLRIQPLIHTWLYPIIAINKANIISRSHRHTSLACSNQSTMLYRQAFHPRIPACIFIQDSQRVISRAVIDADNFYIRECLCQDAVQAFPKKRFALIDWHDDRNSAHGLTSANTQYIRRKNFWKASAPTSGTAFLCIS